MALDLGPIKAGLAKYYDTTQRTQAANGGDGDRERVSLYYLNLVAYMGEWFVGPLVEEVERLRAELAARDGA